MRLYAVAVLLLAGTVPAHSDDLENKFQQLKEAAASKDANLVKKLAVETCALAREEASKPAPESDTLKELWPKRVAYLKDVEAYAEYSLLSTALASPPATTIDLITTLEQQNARSKYLDQAYARYFLALQQTGASAKIPVVAERVLKNFPENEDALIVLADNAMERRQTDRALIYAERTIAAVSKHGKPEGMAAADWERKRSLALGRSHWIAGVVHSEKGQHYEADKDLRAALPLIRGSDAMMASALFYLGVSNYQLAASMRDRSRMLEAAKFSEQCAGIKSHYAQQAWTNAAAMRAEAQKLR